MRGSASKREKLVRRLLMVGIVAVLAFSNAPTVFSLASSAYHDYEINQQSYKENKGHWSVLPVPSKFQVNAVHAALLYTGKVLIIAGSGNDEADFKAGTFKSIVWNPTNNEFKEIPTPSDMFCGGHFELPDGKLLIAGGTKRYEVLASQVKRAAGVMTIRNESTDGEPAHFPKGTMLTSTEGIQYRTTEEVTVDPATKQVGADGQDETVPTNAEVWVEAVEEGRGSLVEKSTRFVIEGVSGEQSETLFGVAVALTMEKQNFWGTNKSWLFNPATESYERVNDLQFARWYPTLVGLKDGRVLAVSGLDKYGRLSDGQTEAFSPATNKWEPEPKLNRVLPTYPALLLMNDGNLFFTGGNAGYGSAKLGTETGIWNTTDNSFKEVPGLKDPEETETSGSVLLPPAQAQKVMMIGGGGVGSSEKSTSRTAIIDLLKPNPEWEDGPSLAQPTRYPIAVITPDNTVIITGGSRYYRGNHGSDILECHVYNPQTNKLTSLASPTVGRNYHSEGLLLPDGRIITLGGNPLYSHANDTGPNSFEKRIEIYTPPYLYHGKRPEITGGPQELTRGSNYAFETPNSSEIRTANLLRPGSYTHVTDVEQRSVALNMAVDPAKKQIVVTIPSSDGIVPPGWYMLFVTNRQATPSIARWVHVS
ncbi:MAG TPA: galactose oxidase-like domain-containing protein [Solirubrobacteraceae bacterium]|jgi:hypothetical protein